MKLNRTGSNWTELERNKVNENWDIIEGSYNDVVGQITDEVVGHLIDSAKLIWKEPVDTVEDLPDTAEVGETRMVREADPDGISYVYRYDGENWEKIQAIDVTLVNEVDSRLTRQLADIATRTLGTVNIKSYEHLKAGDDWTPAWEQLILETPEHYTILFPTDIYHGNFVSTGKSFKIDLMNSIIVPKDDLLPPIRFQGYLGDTYSVVGNPVYGNLYFDVSDATGISEGDIGFLVDESKRPSDNLEGVNTELLKVLSVDSDLNRVYVYDMIRSDQLVGNVSFRKLNTIKNPRVYNVNIHFPNTNDRPGIWFYGCEDPVAENVETLNNVGHAVRFHYCYNPKSEDIRPKNPRLVGGGEGYGVTLIKCRGGSFKNIHGSGTRHIFDADSSYGYEIESVKDDNSQGAGVMLSHNGYGGNVKGRNVEVTTDGYAVYWSNQGVENGNLVTVRDVDIVYVKHVVPTSKPNTTINSVYIVGDHENVDVEHVDTYIVDTTEEPTNASSAVRLLGNPKGKNSIKNISANVIGQLARVSRRSNAPAQESIMLVDNLYAEKVVNCVFALGQYSLNVDNIAIKDEVKDFVIVATSSQGIGTQNLTIGENITTKGKLLNMGISNVARSQGLLGKYPKTTRTSNVAITFPTDSIIPFQKILESGGYLRLNTSGGNYTLNTTNPFEPPLWAGQEFTLEMVHSSGSITIPRGSSTFYDKGEDVVLQALGTYRFIGYNGKWQLLSKVE